MTWKEKSAICTNDSISHVGCGESEKPYHCDATFSQCSKLTIHKSVHTGENPHHHELCSKTFSRKEHLTLHKCIYSGEKPCRYGICGNVSPVIHQGRKEGMKKYERLKNDIMLCSRLHHH
ncbi:zinc finger protein 492-like [Octopus bimaculoides]|uniref:zinc finger protein 492-like n=1 Tax=Octopus bimaculoides TaxID=37653 RepID=UPI0022E1B642|nr:zinc finger protein 492-like [Octopus bimaculoides]